MLRWILLAASVLTAAGSTAPNPPAASDPDVKAGIALVEEGDFEAALKRLDDALPALLARPDARSDLTLAYLYLGISHLELDQESLARARFREALATTPDLRVDQTHFSAQVVRVFESTRSAIVAAAQPKTSPAAPSTKKRSATPFLVAGGGVAAVGVALAAGGGDSPAASTTTTTRPASTTTSTTTTTTTTTTQPPAPSCSYSITPDSVSVGRDGGTGSCQVHSSPSSCRWTAEPTVEWLSITSGRTGTGNGTIRFRADRNEGSARKGRIRLAEDHDVRCEVQQSDEDVQLSQTSLEWSSDLELEGGSGQVVLDGQGLRFQPRGRIVGNHAARQPEGRIEAVLIEGRNRPGTWRFELSGSYQPGSLRVLAGTTQAVTPTSITFRLRGVPGERLVLTFRTGP